MSEQIRLSAISSASLKLEAKQTLIDSQRVLDKMDFQIDPSDLDGTFYYINQIDQTNEVLNEKKLDLLGFSLVFVAPSILGFVCNAYLW